MFEADHKGEYLLIHPHVLSCYKYVHWPWDLPTANESILVILQNSEQQWLSLHVIQRLDITSSQELLLSGKVLSLSLLIIFSRMNHLMKARVNVTQCWRNISNIIFIPQPLCSTQLAMVSRLSENKGSYEWMLFTTNLFIANPLKHLRSCLFLNLKLLWKDNSSNWLTLFHLKPCSQGCYTIYPSILGLPCKWERAKQKHSENMYPDV